MSKVDAVHAGDLYGNPAGGLVAPDGVHFGADFDECRVAVDRWATLPLELQGAELALDPPYDGPSWFDAMGRTLPSRPAMY